MAEFLTPQERWEAVSQPVRQMLDARNREIERLTGELAGVKRLLTDALGDGLVEKMKSDACIADLNRQLRDVTAELQVKEQRDAEYSLEIGNCLGDTHDTIRQLETALHLEEQRAIGLENTLEEFTARDTAWANAVRGIELCLQRRQGEIAHTSATGLLREMGVAPCVDEMEEEESGRAMD